MSSCCVSKLWLEWLWWVLTLRSRRPPPPTSGLLTTTSRRPQTMARTSSTKSPGIISVHSDGDRTWKKFVTPKVFLIRVCTPLSALGRDPVVGRFMVAARDIEAGEVIFHDEPACIGELSLHTRRSGLECEWFRSWELMNRLFEPFFKGIESCQLFFLGFDSFPFHYRAAQ